MLLMPKITPMRLLRSPEPDVTRAERPAQMVALILASAVSLVTLHRLDAQPAAISEFRSIWRVALEEIIRARPGRSIVVLNETVASCESPTQLPCVSISPRNLAAAAPEVSDGDRKRVIAALAERVAEPE